MVADTMDAVGLDWNCRGVFDRFSKQCGLWQGVGGSKDLGRHCEYFTQLGHDDS